MVFENTVQIGIGAYTAPEIAKVLQLPVHKVRRWMHDYWDGTLGEAYARKYSWKSDGSRAVSFHTLIEFYVMMQLSEAGVKPKQVLIAHQALAGWYHTPFPFALKVVLQSIRTDSRRIYLQKGEETISLDGTRQLNMEFIRMFFQRLDFDDQNLAMRFWPLGREKSVVLDPSRKMGHPVIAQHNIYPETLFNHFLAGDPIPYIARVYQLSVEEVQHALEYCEAA